MKTTLSTGKRLADDEAARLLANANGVPAVGNEPLREQIAEFAKAVTESMGSMAKVDEFVEALQSRGGGDVDNGEWTKGNETPEQAAEIMRLFTQDLAMLYVNSASDDVIGQAVSALLNSVDNFHRRYGTASKPNAVENQTKAFAQESGEYIYAIAAGKLDQGAKELADVLYTVFGVAMLAGITREQLADAMYAIAASNDAKTVENGWDWNARGTKVEKLK